MIKKRNERKIFLGLALASVFIVLMIGISLQSTRQFIAASQRVTHIQETLNTLGSIISAVADIETGSRGFVITGQDPFLEPFRAGLTNAAEGLRHLKFLTERNREMQQQISLLERQISNRIRYAEQAISL